MAIYNIFEREEQIPPPQEESVDIPTKGRLFSSVAARLFFLFLLVVDLLWGMYALLALLLSYVGSLFHKGAFEALRQKSTLTLKRACVCGISLFVGIFSPAFGLMIACGYFLVNDKAGISEVVPSSLRDQFKGLFP